MNVKSTTKYGLILLWTVLATGLQLIRQSGQSSLDTVWAEDGTLFFQQAVSRDGFWGLLVEPYAGYGHLVPRLLTEVGLLFGVSGYAIWVAVSSSVLVALLGLFCFYALREVLPSPLLRGALALAVVFQPIVTQEVSASFANLQWYFLFPLFVALFIPIIDRTDWKIRLLLVGVTPLFVPLSLLFVPFVALRCLYLRRRDYATLGGVFGLAVLGQLMIVSGAESATSTGTFYLGQSMRVFAERVLTQFVFSEQASNFLWQQLGWIFTVGAITILAAGLVAGWLRSDRQKRLLIVFLLMACVGLFLFALFKRAGIASLMVSQPSMPMNFAASRYQVAPVLFLVTAILIAAPIGQIRTVFSELITGGKRNTFRKGLFGDLLACVPVIFLTVAMATNLVSFRDQSPRSNGPSWSQQIDTAKAVCLDEQIQAANFVVPPGGATWTTQILCADLK